MKSTKLNMRYLIGMSFFACLTFNPGQLAAQKGIWQFQSYPGNIIKSTFTPTAYKFNEQISNAVILNSLGKLIPSNNIQEDEVNSSVTYNLPGNIIRQVRYFDSGLYKGFQFNLNGNEKIFGTGERALPMNRRGYRLNLYNQPNYGYGVGAENLNYSVPFLISSGGYGIFFDNPARSYVDIGKANSASLEYGTMSGELTFYLIPGNTMDEILRKYQALTGRQPLPARWVFGNLMSRFGYRSEAQLTGIIKEMKKQRFPIDAIILDLFWFGDSIKGTMGNLAWVNKKAWPDPKKMISTFNQQGIKTIIITEPYILNTTPNYSLSKNFLAVDSSGNPFLIRDFYFGQGGLLDIYRKDAQDWFWKKYREQIKNGVTGWWGDLGEPERHPQEMYHNLKDLGFKRLFKADEVHNIYGHYWDKMLYDRYASEFPSVRIFNLNRSGFAGSQRYGIFPWSGDVGRTWSGLQAQLPVMLGMSMSGIPYIHADAGGFALGEGDPQLYTRWIQFAVFTPVLRPHGTALGDLAPEVKNIPSEAALYDEPYRSVVRKYINLRYQLLPYNYNLAYRQAEFGEPLVRPLYYFNYADSNLFKAADQFMWGGSILVAPVLEKDVIEKKIYLPEGDWYDLFTDKILQGKQWITQTIKLNDIPVFIKAGSIIPSFTSKNFKNTNDYTGKNISIKYYPSEHNSSYSLYNDDGGTRNNIATGNYQLLQFSARTTANKVEIKISNTGEMKVTRNLLFSLPKQYKVVKVLYDNKPIKILAGNKFMIGYYDSASVIEILIRPS